MYELKERQEYVYMYIYELTERKEYVYIYVLIERRGRKVPGREICRR